MVTELMNFYIVLLTVTHRIIGTLKLFPSSRLEIAEVDTKTDEVLFTLI